MKLKVLGIWFNSAMKWTAQVENVLAKCRWLRPALRHLRKHLSVAEFLQVVTSNYYSVLYYGSEIWFNCLTQKQKLKLWATHYYPLRLAVNDFKRRLSSCQNKKSLPSRSNYLPCSKMFNCHMYQLWAILSFWWITCKCNDLIQIPSSTKIFLFKSLACRQAKFLQQSCKCCTTH